MPLLLLDLDDTLLDRTSALREWGRGFFGADLEPGEIGWMLDADAGAPGSVHEFAQRLRRRYGRAETTEEVAGAVQDALVSGLAVRPALRAALVAAREAGWSLVVVTNGAERTQEHKIRRAGVDGLVDAWVVSESVGVWKPDPLIFEHAAKRGGQPLDGAWMIGDNPHSDIAGACRVGIQSVWVSAGRDWPRELEWAPTKIADDCADAVAAATGLQLGA